jgi:uncharacterized protein (TIGR00369 family)
MEMSGLEYVRAIHAGELPQAPIAVLMGFDLCAVEEGSVSFDCEPGEHLYNPMNAVHGGLALTMLDSAMGASVHTTLPQGQLYSTLETKVNLVRPIRADSGRLVAEGRVIHRGSRTATAEAHLRDESGKLYAHGTSTCLILGG